MFPDWRAERTNLERIPFCRFYWREFVLVGVLGGFTTYSSFELDTYTLARSEPSAAISYLAIQIIGGLGAVWAGHAVAIAAGYQGRKSPV